jgi:hypothetical protein
MAEEKAELFDRLSALIGDLRSLPGAPLAQLEHARIAVARAIATGQKESITREKAVAPVIGSHALSAEHRASFESIIDSVTTQPAPTPEFLVARREVPISATGLPNITPDWASGRAIDSSVGPFLDAVGRLIWIDFFQIVTQTQLVRTAGGVPFLSLPLKGLLTIKSDHFTLPAGSVWIASQQIASGAPAGGYTGLRIKGGTLTFSHSVSVTGNETVVPAGVTCTLALKLHPGTVPKGVGAGDDARQSAAEVPTSVTFVFSAIGAKIQSVAKARVTVYGSSIKLEPTTNIPVYLADAARIFVPAKTNAKSFKVDDVRSDEFRPDGKAEISGTAWTLPVAIISPTSFGNAAGAGGLALVLKDGLTLTWKGQRKPTAAGPVTLIVDTGLITLLALAVRGVGSRETIPLWSPHPGEDPSSQIDLRWPTQFPLRFFSAATGAELLILIGSIKGNFDRPVTVNGKRVFIHAKTALIFFIESSDFNGVIVEAVLDSPPHTRALALAIANSVFRVTPAATLLLVAAYDGAHSPAGGAVIGFGLQYLLPTLPDPYAANFGFPFERQGDFGTVGALNAFILWSPANPTVLTYTLPTAQATASPVEAPQVGLPRNTKLAVAARQSGALILLDLSTNVDQFGVAWESDRVARTGVAVDSMYIVIQSQSVYLLTVPAVQWEPVFTETQLPPPSPPFPTPVTFTNSGGPTLIGVQSVQLVRVAPAPALDFLVDNFNNSATPQSALARFTLPFGIEAFSTLRKPNAAAPRGAEVDYNRPQFTQEAIRGGYQISIRAIDPASPDSPSLEGSTTQRIDNLLQSGVPVVPARSILDTDVDTIFNAYLGPSSATAQVPVTRIDLSGYGESLFSHWVNPVDDAVSVAKARFDVLVGRTSVEVVQVRSILFPYGVRVVRTITIFRKNSGSVIRRDSGWQAATDGAYLFPGIGLTTHPGVVQKIRNVTNIRDTGQIIDLAGGAEVAGVVFDGDLVIENAVKGASPSGVPARSQIGYVQLKPTGNTILTAAQYEELIKVAGPLGGTIDCIFNVGNSGQLMKLGRVGVGVTPGMGGPEFVMTAWGSPQFPQGGQWSFLRQTSTGAAPQVVDKDLGIPLVRAGAAPAAPPLTSPYRFADPVDLSRPTTPFSDYGILHATGTQRVFFPRPKIEATSTRITSTRPPVLADPYALANSVGFFPRTDSAIPFPDANYSIAISGGNYKLQLPTPNFPVTVGQRTIAEAGGVRSYADYAGAIVELAIDTSAAVPWSFRLKDVNLATSSTLLGEVIRAKSTVDAAADIATALLDPKLIFGGALGVVQDIMEFLQALGFPTPLKVSMTNKLEFRAELKIPMDEELNKLLPPGGPEFDDTDVAVSLVISIPVVEAAFEFGATILIPTPFDPLKAVGMIKIEIKMSTADGTSLALTVGAGLGVSFDIAGFGCKAYFMETMFLIAGDSVLGFGVGLLIKGSVDLAIVSVDVTVEAKMAILKVSPSATCAGMTIWGAAQLTFAIEISICWIIDIDIEVQAETSQNLNGGPCELPDVL